MSETSRDLKLIPVKTYGIDKVNAFYHQEYPPAKAEYIEKYNEWHFRGNDVRYVLVDTETDVIVGHVGSFHANVLLDGEPHLVHWAFDLMVGKEYRAHGYHRRLDTESRSFYELVMNFPNHVSRVLLKRNGWQQREDGYRYLLQLSPRAYAYLLKLQATFRRPRRLQRVSRLKRLWYKIEDKLILLAGMGGAWPLTALRRAQIMRYTPQSATRLENPSPELLEDVFMRHNASQDVVTTYRDADYLQWRYFDYPFKDQLSYYINGPADAPDLVVIMRIAPYRKNNIARILDIFGDFTDQVALKDCLQLAMRDAARAGADSVMGMAWYPPLIEAFRSLPFVEADHLVFAWINEADTEMQERIKQKPYHWVVGDSDSDYL